MGSLSYLRRKYWEVFYYLHTSLSLVSLLSVIIHSSGVVIYLIPGLLIYLVDIYYRYKDGIKCAIIEEMFTNGDLTTIKLSLQTHPHFANRQAGSFAYLYIPSLMGNFSLGHPFTIASCPSSDQLIFHIKNMGPNTFTGHLFTYASNNQLNYKNPMQRESSSLEENKNTLSNHKQQTKIYIWGPYGKLNVSLEESRIVVLFAGGIGITPFLSIYAGMKEKKKKGYYSKLESLHFIWITRSNTKLIESVIEESDISHGFHSQVYNSVAEVKINLLYFF